MMYGLIFDVDGVIADTESVSGVITAEIFADLFNIHGVKYEDFDAGRGMGAEAYLHAAGVAHGVELTAAQIDEAAAVREERFMEFLTSKGIPPLPGVLDIVNAGLEHSGIKLAIATSSTREKSKMVLTSAGVPYEKMFYITGSDVSAKKPDPELFLKAAKGIDVAPERCLVIEDAPSGIKAAKNAHCKCIAVTNSFSNERLTEADRIVSSLEEISIDDVIDIIEKD